MKDVYKHFTEKQVKIAEKKEMNFSPKKEKKNFESQIIKKYQAQELFKKIEIMIGKKKLFQPKKIKEENIQKSETKSKSQSTSCNFYNHPNN